MYYQILFDNEVIYSVNYFRILNYNKLIIKWYFTKSP